MSTAHALDEDRARSLRTTALGVLVALAWIIVVGMLFRAASTSVAAGTLVGIDAQQRATPTTLSVAPGASVVELRRLFDRHGVADAVAVEDILEAQRTVVPGAGRPYLAPGTYGLSPTSDATGLLSAMGDAFAEQFDADLLAEIDRRGLELHEVTRVAALAEQVARSRAELPVLTAVLWNRRQLPDPASVVVSVDALRAAVYPATSTARVAWRDGSGDLRLDDQSDPSTHSRRQPLLDALVSRVLQGAGGRHSVLVIDSTGAPRVASHEHRYVETASVYKLAVLAVAVHEVQHGNLDLDRPLLAQLDAPATSLSDALTLREALTAMITLSDNATAEVLLGALGPAEINGRLREWGVVEFSVGSRPQVATAHGVAQLMEQIQAGSQFSLESRLLMLDLLYRTDQSTRLAADIGAPVAHKTGDLATVVNDAGVVPTSEGSMTVVALVDDVDVRPNADRAIARLGSLITNWFDAYVGAEAAVRNGTLRGCVQTQQGDFGPLAGKRIALDPGHGGHDPGAQAELADGTVLDEAVVVLIEAEMIRDRLIGEGAAVLLTRCDDRSLSVTERSALINGWNPDIAVSLHIDGSEQSGVDSSSVLYLDDAAAVLAEAIHGSDEQPGMWAALDRMLPLGNGGVLRRSIGPLPFVATTTVLTEPVVLTHPAEAAALSDGAIRGSQRLQVIVDAHVDGIIRYFSGG